MSRFGCGFVIAGGGFRRDVDEVGVAAEMGDEGFAAAWRWRGAAGMGALWAGQAFIDPAVVRMIRFNRSVTDGVWVVIFYVSDPEGPFLEVIR